MDTSQRSGQLRFSIRGLMTSALVVAVLIAFAIQQHRVGILENQLEELRGEQQISRVDLRRAIIDQQKSQLERRRLIKRQDALENYVKDPPVRYLPLATRRVR